MLFKTRGIIFKVIKYAESSLILDIYTEEKGLKKYIISGVRNRRSKVKTGLLQPASLVDMVAYFREQKAINRIKEVKAAYSYQSIPFDLLKGAISLFMIELAQKTIKEEVPNPDLFGFLFNQFVQLDHLSELQPDFHLTFMLELSQLLGIFPGGEWSRNTPWIDMQEGLFVHSEPLHQYGINMELSKKIGLLMTKEPADLTRTERQKIVEKLIDYYRIHLEAFNGLNAHAILREVLEG